MAARGHLALGQNWRAQRSKPAYRAATIPRVSKIWTGRPVGTKVVGTKVVGTKLVRTAPVTIAVVAAPTKSNHNRFRGFVKRAKTFAMFVSCFSFFSW